MWETIVGRALYRRETQYETMHAVIHEAPPPLRKYRKGVPESLDAIIQKALAKDPAKRHSSAGVLQGELELWLAENRMVVNSATIARVMDELYEQEIQRGPLVDTNPFGSSFQSLPDKGRPPTPEHSSGSMSAAHPLSHPSITSATPAPLHVPRSRAPKFAILAFLGLLGLGLAMYAMRERDRELEVGATADGESIGESPDAADALREELDERGATGDAGALLPLVATHALIELTYRPAAARVELDGQLISGESPLSIDAISPGSHRIVVTAPDHRPFEEELDFVAGERVEITAHLTPLPRGPAAPPGRISINTRPWSKVYVGPRLLGTTPIADARVTSGAVRLRLVDRDGRTHTKTVRVPAGGSERVFYDLGH
jgi:serine/threonine-protein kinase